jgi:malate synthase
VRQGRFTPARVREVEREELARIKTAVGDEAYAAGRYDDAAEVFEKVALADEFVEFLTLPAYNLID